MTIPPASRAYSAGIAAHCEMPSAHVPPYARAITPTAVPPGALFTGGPPPIIHLLPPACFLLLLLPFGDSMPVVPVFISLLSGISKHALCFDGPAQSAMRKSQLRQFYR
jgi:hypothetical protein